MLHAPRRAASALFVAAVVLAALVGVPFGASGGRGDVAGAAAACPGPGSDAVEITLAGGRTARVSVPAAPSGDVVVALHGYGSSGARLAAASGLEEAAGALGAAVVLPAGSGDPARWSLTGRLRGGDDLRFLGAVLAACGPSGTGRLVLAGFSNGAAFAAELACRLGPVVDALVLVGGAGLAAPCPAGTPPWTVVVHGAADRVVPVAGGPVLGGRLRAAPLDDAAAAVDASRVVVVPGWGHTWPAAATDEVLAALAG